MAFGDLVLFNALSEEIADGTHDLDGHTFGVALITEVAGSGVTAADAAHSLTDYTEVNGTGYAAGGYTLTSTWTRTANVTKFNADDAAWAITASGVGGINVGLLYNKSNGVGLGYVNLNNGIPADLSTDNISITWDNAAEAIFSLTV